MDRVVTSPPMTLSPEERAKAALDRHFAAGAANFPLVEAVATAIREACNEKLEGAKRYVALPVLASDNEDVVKGFNLGIQSAQLSIDALKDPTP